MRRATLLWAAIAAAGLTGCDHRYQALTAHHCYQGMEYTEDKQQLSEWTPLVMEGRDPGERVAATRMITGADVNYGALTRELLRYLQGLEGFTVHFSHHVTDLRRSPNGLWRIDGKGAISVWLNTALNRPDAMFRWEQVWFNRRLSGRGKYALRRKELVTEFDPIDHLKHNK